MATETTALPLTSAIAALSVPTPDGRGEFATPAEGAKYMASFGIPQVPLRGKDPSIGGTGWHDRATTDPDEIDRWYGELNCNFGSVAKAEATGFWVFEGDSREVYRRRKEETGSKFAPTLAVLSGSERGWHLWYEQSPESLAMGNISQSVVRDRNFSCRVHNQMCVSPGSVHPETGKQYVVTTGVPPAVASAADIAWLIAQRATAKTSDGKVVRPAGWMYEPILHHSINDTMYAIAVHLRHAGLNEGDILAIILEKAHTQCFHIDGVTPFVCNTVELEKVVRSACKDKSTDEQRLANFPWIGGKSPEEAFFEIKLAEAKARNPRAAEQQTGWTEPKPFGNALSPVLPFKPEYLPESVRPWVKDVSGRMSVPLDFAGICCLVVLAGCVNRRAFVYPKAIDKDWQEALAISGAVVASSGKTKTPTWKVFTNPLLELEIEWQDEYKQRAAEYEQALRQWKDLDKEARRSRQQAKQNAKKNQPAPASLFEPDDSEDSSESIGPMPELPDPCRRLMTNDATPEKFHILASENAGGLFVYRDELSGWVAELDQDNRAAEREMFLLAMTGNDSFTLDRVERGTVSAILSASLFGGFQPDLFVEVLSNLRNVSDGTLPRFGLLVYPDDVELPLVDRVVDDGAKQRYRRIIRSLASLRAESVILNFAPDAQRVFTEWLALHTKRVNQMPEGGLKSHFAKYKGLLPKLAGLLQLVDLADKNPVVSGCQLIDAAHLESAVQLLRYLESHAVRAYGCIRSPLAKTEAALASHLRKGDLQDGFSVRTIKRKHWADLTEEREIEDALKSFEELGWIRVMTGVQGQGRPTTRWELNPALHPAHKESKR